MECAKKRWRPEQQQQRSHRRVRTAPLSQVKTKAIKFQSKEMLPRTAGGSCWCSYLFTEGTAQEYTETIEVESTEVRIDIPTLFICLLRENSDFVETFLGLHYYSHSILKALHFFFSLIVCKQTVRSRNYLQQQWQRTRSRVEHRFSGTMHFICQRKHQNY